MNKKKPISRMSLIFLAALLLCLAGCKALRPVKSIPTEEQSPLFVAPTFQATALPGMEPTTQALQELNPAQPADCTNGLSYVSEPNYPDGTHVAPGAIIDKQWQIKNSGTCNWDDSYSLTFISGDQMGAASPLALVPARNGTETTINIQFTAPSEAGRYKSIWKACGPDGEPFGDPIYIEIVVATQ